MQKFTPGPWRACRAGDCSCGQIFGGDGNSVVARAFGRADLDEADVVPDEAAQLANARLISAAPELVEALRDVTQHLHVLSAGEVDDPKAGITGWRECHEAIDRARAALAKATGA